MKESKLRSKEKLKALVMAKYVDPNKMYFANPFPSACACALRDGVISSDEYRLLQPCKSENDRELNYNVKR